MAPVKIACTTVYDALDRRAMGGRVYHRMQAMRCADATVHFVGPLSHLKYGPLLFVKRAYYKYKSIGRVRYFPRRDRRLVKDYARQIERRLRGVDAQIIFSPESPGSQPVAYLEAKQPIVIWTDTTLAGVLDFYPEYRREAVCPESLRDGLESERMALGRASLAIYYSDWAAEYAVRIYGLDPAKVRVIAPGPALDHPITHDEAQQIVRARPKDFCRLLFVGIDWERKGGDTAIEVTRRLNAAGIRTELVMVGSKPPFGTPLPEFVRVLGRISRATGRGDAALNELFKTSHFLLVPSRAEAFGLAFTEANAFALPSLGTDVGGIPEIIRSGINGATFPVSADPEQYCAFVGDLYAHRDRYEQLALSAFAEFQTRLNNRTAALSLVETMKELL